METVLFDYIARFMLLSDEEKKVILDLDIFRTYKKRAVLLKQGQHSTDGYFVIKGCLRCYYVLDGDEKTTAFYTEAESLTPPCTVNRQPSEFYVACVEDSIVLVANTQMEAVVFEKSPGLRRCAEFYQKNYWLNIRHRLTISDFPRPNSGI